jgi:hypothetical protein
MHARKVIPSKVFRALCLLTAAANFVGNLVMLLFYKPICALTGAPLPVDLPNFAFVCGFSLTVGVLSFMVFLAPERSGDLLVVGLVGKAIYALFSFYFYLHGALHWFYMLFGIWDAAYAVIFFLYFIQLASPDLTRLNRGEILPALDRPRTGRALLVYFSMTGNGTRAMKSVREGLTRRGYIVDDKVIEPVEPLFHFPFSLLAFFRIMIRAIFRVPAKIKPLGVPADHPYDLIVVESQTWFVGMSAPVEAIFQDPAGRAIFAGRDVAAVNVCRGLWQRPQAMLVRWLAASGANVVGARAYENPGVEPIRCFSLFYFLARGGAAPTGLLKKVMTPQHIDEAKERELAAFGELLARRIPGLALELSVAEAATLPSEPPVRSAKPARASA